ncbi:pyridoxal phosphate-dependent transferase [Fusarium tricinctum]|uniref:Pyridoxal phosphate-dependent transferase n=1 Tax=Fusarium tricinctum TaxID=61284 RepID=A0A8K0RHS6_9HYPO|nr:pyridoxal phosphate-dependent transferase [Fusarium tricinctum]
MPLVDIEVDKQSSSPSIATFRHLVPLVNQGSVTYLNASFAPPRTSLSTKPSSNMSRKHYTTVPKPKWQACPPNITFTGDTTEAPGSVNQGLHFKPGDNVVLLDSKHPNTHINAFSTIDTAKKATKVTAANVPTCAPYVDDRTIVIRLSSVMFHSGQWNDVADILGFAIVDVQNLEVSAAAFSLHKGFQCPTGLAALYIDPKVIKDVNVTPPILVPDAPAVYHLSAQRYDHLNPSLISGAVAKAYLSFYFDVLGPQNLENHLYTLRYLILDLHDERWMAHFLQNGVIVTPYRLGVRVSFWFCNNSEHATKLVRVL